MKKLFLYLFLSLLGCSGGIAGEREPGTDEKCFYVFERENIFEKKFLPKVKMSEGVFVTYIGCNKYYDDWSWEYASDVDINKAHLKAHGSCDSEQKPKYDLTGCHLFSIDDVIVWGKDVAFVKKVEEEANAGLKTKLAKLKTNLDKKQKESTNAAALTESCIRKGTKIFTKEVKPFADKNKKSAVVMYFGCKSSATWGYQSWREDDLNKAKEKALIKCLTRVQKDGIKNCHLFSIGDKIVYGKDAAFKAEVEEKLNKKLAKNKKKGGANYAQKYLFWDDIIFTKKDPTTFKKLTFKKEKNISDVNKKVKYSDKWNKKKKFRSYSFTAEYENNITVELLVEYEKDKKDFEKAEEKALFYSKMYGQMPNFLKTYNKKIYIHNDFAESNGTGSWWVMYNKLEFHVNGINCQQFSGYSRCATVMVHELGHVIQKLTGVISPSKWLKARKLDKKKYATEYAKTNSKEDFAESITAWIGVRYKSDKINKSDLGKFNEFIPNRLKLFDEMNFKMYPIVKKTWN
jgi:hypothetical protein